MGNYSQNELRKRAFFRIAWNIHNLWEEKGSSDSRLLEAPIISDDLILVGKSLKGAEHREHVVPRALICYECHRLYQEGAKIEDVAILISKFLKIVLISKAEQKYLDYTLGLKIQMPDGWTFMDGDPYARLKAANIEFR